MKYGIAGNLANLSVEDPNGDTDSTNTSYLSGFVLTPLNRNQPSVRLWYELSYRSFDLDPSTTNIGQEVSSLSLSATIQKGWSSKMVDAYWVGIGGELNLDDYSKRLTVDSDGFINQQFNDRNETILGVLLNAGFNLPKTSGGYVYGFNFNYRMPIDDGINGISASFFVMW